MWVDLPRKRWWQYFRPDGHWALQYGEKPEWRIQRDLRDQYDPIKDPR